MTIHARDLDRRAGIQVRAFHERNERRADQYLVRQRVHQNAEVGDQAASARDAPVQIIGETGHAEKNQGQRVVVPKGREQRHRKSTVSANRDTVSLFGKFIS